MTSEDTETIKVRTTLPKLPLPPNEQRAAIKTARLTIRPLAQDDLQGLHVLRTQPEVMTFTAVGRVDRDLDETQTKMDMYLPPNDAHSFNFVICLSDTDELIGIGGMHKTSLRLGWPEIGYMFKHEHWGKGYATEFMSGFLEAWWKLEREDVEVNVDALSVNVKEGSGVPPTVPEYLVAMVESNNGGSLRIMEKTGFRMFKSWSEPDSRAGFEGQDVTLIGFYLGKQPLP